MKAHIAAITALLTPLGYPVYFTEAPDSPSFPYLLLWSSAGSPSSEQSVTDVRTDIDATVGVTACATSPDGVLIVAARVRGILAPSGSAKVLTVAGRLALLRMGDSRPVEVDRDVTLPSTGHPAYGADLYRLISTPA